MPFSLALSARRAKRGDRLKTTSIELSRARRRIGWGALVALGALALLAVGCGNTSDAAEGTPTANPVPQQREVVSADFRVRSELVFGTTSNLAFELAGEVGTVAVAVGDRVSRGDLLATIDAETINDLQHAQAQAEFNLDRAQDRLDAVLGLESPDPLVRAQAQAELSKAEVALERAEEALEDYQLDYEVALGTARKGVADAEFSLDAAQEAVSDFIESHSEILAANLATRSAARTNLDRARDAVTDFLPLHNEAVAAMKTQISGAENQLDAAQKKLRDFDASHADRIAQARVELAVAEAALEAAQDRFTDFHIKIIDGQFLSLPDGQNFDVVEFNALQSAVDAAQRDVEFWEDEIAELEVGPKEVDRIAAASDVARLESELQRLNRRLREEVAGPDQDELARLEANVLVAREELDRAERELADTERGVDQLELARLQAATESARLALASAKSKLTRLEEGIDETVLADLAQTVATAREARDDLAGGPDPADVALARANLDAAKIDYADIQQDLKLSQLRAPFDGVVRLVTIEPGDVITVDARVIQLVDPSDISVLGLVETNHIERIDVGTQARVTLAALPDVTLDARVVEKSGEARTERGVISFPVVFSVEVPPGVTVPPNPGLVTTTVGSAGDGPPGPPGRQRPGG